MKLKTATARAIVEGVLGPNKTREIWTGNYEKALPVTVQDFDLGAVLPAVFYMFRFGCRRGKGTFQETFGGNVASPQAKPGSATIEQIAECLSKIDSFSGFDADDADVKNAILGDLLLCFCLENRHRSLGRREQVQRVAPAHYMASWVDLPNGVANLRFVPEMIVSLLANQSGDWLKQSQEGERTWFAVGQGFENNVLLKAFNHGMQRKGLLGDRASDHFQEEVEVGLDQLLMIRLAQQLGNPPDKLRGANGQGGDRISNQRPIAEFATLSFTEDLRRFTQAYGEVVPRLSFVKLLESCMAVGLTTIVTSTVDLLFQWAATGAIPIKAEQQPPSVFVDCSNGMDRQLRALAEQSLDDLVRRIERFPTVLMALRLLDHGARHSSKLKNLDIPTRPYATEWLNMLGDLLRKNRTEAGAIHDDLELKASELAEKLEAEEVAPEAVDVLRNEAAQSNPVWRMAEALTLLQGRKNAQDNVMSLFDSASMVNRPNGLATKRPVKRKHITGETARKRDMRSLVFTDPVLDYFVHRHVLRSAGKGGHRRLSFREFLSTLHERHGFCIDVAPPNVHISNDLLHANRAVLERRLRDLGLLIGVNDAEAMKHLQPRFETTERLHDLD
jgi:hypothetical protein